MRGNWKSRERETGMGNGNEKREIVLGSSPRFPNEYYSTGVVFKALL